MRSAPLKLRLIICRIALLVVLLPKVLMGQATPPASFDSLAAKAEAARTADHVEQAIGFYKQALALRPKWTEGWFYLGTLHYDRNEYALAAKAFRKVTVLDPKSGTGLVMLGLTEFQLGNDDDALKHLQAGEQAGITDNPELQRTVLLDEAILMQRKGHFEAAEESLNILCRGNSAIEEAIQLLGAVQLRLRKDEAAAAPQDLLKRLGEAGCLAAQKRFDDARAQYSAVANDFTKFRNVHYAFGNFLVDVPDIAAARKEFEAEIANQPDDVLSRLKIASALYRTNSADGIPFAQQAVKLDPKAALGHYILGLLLLDVDDYKGAIPELETAKPGFAKEPKLYFALGTAYARAGRTEDAEKARAEFQRLDKLQKAKPE